MIAGAYFGALMGVALVWLHPFGWYLAETVIGIVLVLGGAVVGSELEWN